MYETMAVWETEPAWLPSRSSWPPSRTSGKRPTGSSTPRRCYFRVVPTANTRLERRFDPDSVRDLKASAASDLTVGGPTIAAHAFNAGLVDECQLFVHPVLVGQGKPAFPGDARIQWDLLEERRFGSGAVYLRYRTQS